MQMLAQSALPSSYIGFRFASPEGGLMIVLNFADFYPMFPLNLSRVSPGNGDEIRRGPTAVVPAYEWISLNVSPWIKPSSRRPPSGTGCWTSPRRTSPAWAGLVIFPLG
jgi:hypothetical protein